MRKVSKRGDRRTVYETVDGRYRIQGNGRDRAWYIVDTQDEFVNIGTKKNIFVGTKKKATAMLAEHLADPSISLSKAEKEERDAERAKIDALPIAERTVSLSFHKCGQLNPRAHSGDMYMCGFCGALYHAGPEDVIDLNFKIGDLANLGEVVESNYTSNGEPANMRKAAAKKAIKAWFKPRKK